MNPRRVDWDARPGTGRSATAAVTRGGPIRVAAGETVTLTSTTRTGLLTIASGGTLAATATS